MKKVLFVILVLFFSISLKAAGNPTTKEVNKKAALKALRKKREVFLFKKKASSGRRKTYLIISFCVAAFFSPLYSIDFSESTSFPEGEDNDMSGFPKGSESFVLKPTKERDLHLKLYLSGRLKVPQGGCFDNDGTLFCMKN